MRRWLFLPIIFGVITATPVFATDSSSANYENNASSFAPAAFTAQSANYQISGSIEPAVGSGKTVNFWVQSGVPVTEPTGVAAAPAVAGAGGTGAAGTAANVAVPTFTFRSQTFLSHQLVQGTRASSDLTILVNGSTAGVTYPTALSWQRDVPLFIGANALNVQARSASGNLSTAVAGTVRRLLIGDVNADSVVDDRDLSRFVRAWKTFTPFADFNEDGLINDKDLSLLASHWGARE